MSKRHSSLQEKFHPGDNAFEVVLSGAFASIGLYETPTDEMRERAGMLLKDLGCLEYANRNYETFVPRGKTTGANCSCLDG